MKLINKSKKVKLIVEDSLIEEIATIGMNHFPNEFGGFLIGRYSQDFKTLYISGFILPSKYKGFPYLFERSVDGLKETLEILFEEHKEYYIGEWHTHPNGSTHYSLTDLKAMIDIANCDTVYIENPVLLILSISKENLKDFTFYLYDNKKLDAYG